MVVGISYSGSATQSGGGNFPTVVSAFTETRGRRRSAKRRSRNTRRGWGDDGRRSTRSGVLQNATHFRLSNWSGALEGATRALLHKAVEGLEEFVGAFNGIGLGGLE